MTLEVMAQFGVNVKHNKYSTFYLKANQTYHPTEYTVEGDWSGAAFHLIGGAVAGHVNLYGLNRQSLQADIAILDALTRAGANVSWYEDKLTVSRNKLQAFEFDATHCPDLFPPLANLAAQCLGTSIIKGVSRLAHKESNRAKSIQEEWCKMGISIS